MYLLRESSCDYLKMQKDKIMEISARDREMYNELAVRLSAAYFSYTLGNNSMDYHRKKYMSNKVVDDYWMKLAMIVQKDVSSNIESAFFHQ